MRLNHKRFLPHLNVIFIPGSLKSLSHQSEKIAVPGFLLNAGEEVLNGLEHAKNNY